MLSSLVLMLLPKAARGGEALGDVLSSLGVMLLPKAARGGAVPMSYRVWA